MKKIKSKKQVYILLPMIIASLLLIKSPARAETEPIFTDVQAGNPYYVPIMHLKELNMVQGYEDGKFKPYQDINRAEAIKMLSNAIPFRDQEDEIPPNETQENIFSFEDVTPEDWFYPVIKKAWENKIVSGYPDELFHPQRTINRAEALKIVLLHDEATIPETILTPPYTDVPVDAWFAPFAELSRQKTLFLVDRATGGLNAANNMSRGEFAALIYRLITNKEGSYFVRTTWYGFETSNWGTASGEKFDVNKFTAAHKTLPFGTRVFVTNQANGKSVEAVINDRGPYATGIDLDLTQFAFAEIASIGAGVIVTEFKVILDPEESTESDENIQEEPNVDSYGF
jgi:hypothetical protein